jgi:preprotein translocase subunit SecB
MKANIKLADYQINKMNCEWVPGEIQETQDMVMGVDYNVYQKREDPNHFKLDVFVKVEPKDGLGGIKIDTSIVGFFTFLDGTTEKDKQLQVRYTGFPLLFSTLRGHISAVTSNFPCKTFILPSIIVKDVIESIEKGNFQENPE